MGRGINPSLYLPFFPNRVFWCDFFKNYPVFLHEYFCDFNTKTHECCWWLGKFNPLSRLFLDLKDLANTIEHNHIKRSLSRHKEKAKILSVNASSVFAYRRRIKKFTIVNLANIKAALRIRSARKEIRRTRRSRSGCLSASGGWAFSTQACPIWFWNSRKPWAKGNWPLTKRDSYPTIWSYLTN